MGEAVRNTETIKIKKHPFPKIRALARLPLTTFLKVPLLAKLARNKRAGAGAVIAAGVALIVALGWWGWSSSSLSKLTVNAAVIDGTAEYRLDDADPWERAQKGMSFGEGAQLRTQANSRLSLRITDGSEVRLNGNSSVRLSKLRAQQIIIQSTGGELYARVTDKQSRTFQVSASAASYQAVGMAAYRVFDTSEKQGLETYRSGATIWGLENSPITVWEGKRYFMRNTSNKDTEGKITDLLQADLASNSFLLWNRDLDEERFATQLGVLSDIIPPELTVIEPVDGRRTTEASIVVSGTIEKYATVSINGQVTVNNEGIFESRINLSFGENLITVEATDIAGNKTVKTIKVIRNEPTDFQLTATRTAQGIGLSWSINGITIGNGFQVIMGDYEDPTLSIKTKNVLVGPSERVYTWPIFDGKPHYFRICTYDGQTCTDYSNDVSIVAGTNPQ